MGSSIERLTRPQLLIGCPVQLAIDQPKEHLEAHFPLTQIFLTRATVAEIP